MTDSLRRWRRLLGILAALALFLTACGDDDDETTADDPTGETDDGADDGTDDGSDEGADDPAADGDSDPVNVTLVDYGYPDLPASVPAGTTFTITNESETELHEFVAVRIPDEEERSVEELMQLSQDELFAALGGAPPEPAAVLLQAPGSEDVIPAVGDGTLAEPGRYLVACFIPVGADPAEYLEAAQTSEGPPEVEGGPPHFTQGMFAELTVEGDASADVDAGDGGDAEDGTEGAED